MKRTMKMLIWKKSRFENENESRRWAKGEGVVDA